MAIRVTQGDLEAHKKAHIPIPDMRTTMLGRTIPAGWKAGHVDESTWWYKSEALGLYVLESVGDQEMYGDGKRWHHISVSARAGLPSWEDMGMIKRIFMGHHTTALQVLPPTERYVNIHDCLHLWRCLDGDVTPQFDHMIEGVRHV